MTAQLASVNGQPVDSFTEPRFDPVALAKAEAIRTQAAAEAEVSRIKAEGEAKAAEIAAQAEADKQNILNERAALRLEAEKATHLKKMAELAAATAKAQSEAGEAKAAAQRKAQADEGREREERRTQSHWKWAARGIYVIGLIIALPLQLMAFYSDDKKFMVAAPLLLEGLALVLAVGAAWAVAHRRDVAPYRIGIMIAAGIAAGVNLWHGAESPKIGIEAGIVGALASIGGPIVLMAYEHGVCQKRDGVSSWRERRDLAKASAAAAKDAAEKAAEKAVAEAARVLERDAAEQRAEAEQQRKDDDRKKGHLKVWEIAEAMRSARGLQFVTDSIWGEAWYRVTGSKVVGIWPELEAQSRAAQARMKSASEMPILGPFAQVESQKGPTGEAVDGRRSNGGTPPRRVPGDAQPNSPLARKQAVLEQTTRKAVDNPDERTI